MENEIPARQTGLHRAGQDLRVLAAALATGVLGVHAMPALPPPSALLLLALPALLPWRGRSMLRWMRRGPMLRASTPAGRRPAPD